MGTSQQQKSETRKTIVDAAAKLFRERGVDGVSVAQVMDAAGLTHGGFPRHFASKQELVNAALAEALKATGNADADGIRDFARHYLTTQHRDGRGSGCVFAALGSELSRAPADTRHVLTETIQHQVDVFSRDGEDQRNRNIGSWAAMIGAMVLARIVDSPALSDEILTATRQFVGADEGKSAT